MFGNAIGVYLIMSFITNVFVYIKKRKKVNKENTYCLAYHIINFKENFEFVRISELIN